MNEICKSGINPKKAFWIVLLCIFALMCIFNLTLGKINLLLCDILTLVSVCVGVYFLFRYSLVNYRYILDDKNLTITKIAGKNNEQIQAVIEIKNIEYIGKYTKKAKGALSYCASPKKEGKYLIKAQIDGKYFDVAFEPSKEFLDELSRRKDIINEEI